MILGVFVFCALAFDLFFSHIVNEIVDDHVL